MLLQIGKMLLQKSPRKVFASGTKMKNDFAKILHSRTKKKNDRAYFCKSLLIAIPFVEKWYTAN